MQHKVQHVTHVTPHVTLHVTPYATWSLSLKGHRYYTLHTLHLCFIKEYLHFSFKKWSV